MSLKHIARCVVVTLVATTTFAQSLTEVQRYLLAASRMYENLEYERALDQLKRAKAVAAGVADDAVIDRYEGIVLFDMGRRDEAVAAFRESLYLEPDAPLPVKVSPKITEAFEATRTAVKKELAPILAKRRAEEERKELEKAEAARKESVEREARLKLEAEEARRRADVAQREQLADLQRREDEAHAAELRLAEARRLLAEDERRAEARRKEAALEAERRAAADRPERTDLTPRNPTTPVITQPRVLGPAPFVLGGVTVAAGGVAGLFAYLAGQQLTAAKNAEFQSDTATALQKGNDFALVTNVALGVTAAAAIATIVAFAAGTGAPPPPPPAEVTP